MTDTNAGQTTAPTEASSIDDVEKADSVEVPADVDPTDTFPRSAVEKLRRESAGYRDRANNAEDRLTALQRQLVEQQVIAAGMRPAAVFAVAQLGDLLADDGTIDTGKLTAAMSTAKETFGIKEAPRRNIFGGELVSGTTGRQTSLSGPSFASAFGPRNKDGTVSHTPRGMLLWCCCRPARTTVSDRRPGAAINHHC